MPTKCVLFENMVHLMQLHWVESEHRPKERAAFLLENLLQEYWLFCYEYIIKAQNIKNKILRLYADFMKLLQTQKDCRNDIYNDRVQNLHKEADCIFDIFCENAATRKREENGHRAKMTEQEWDFLKD